MLSGAPRRSSPLSKLWVRARFIRRCVDLQAVSVVRVPNKTAKKNLTEVEFDTSEWPLYR